MGTSIRQHGLPLRGGGRNPPPRLHDNGGPTGASSVYFPILPLVFLFSLSLHRSKFSNSIPSEGTRLLLAFPGDNAGASLKREQGNSSGHTREILPGPLDA